MNPQPGLRERKKQRTRETIARAAHELFAERGYHATTLPEIAEAADVSTRTIFAYFPSKEDILFSEFPLMKEALEKALAERPEGEEALETVREFILSTVGIEKSEVDEELGRCIHNDETLRSHLRARIAQLAEVIVAASSRRRPSSLNQVAPVPVVGVFWFWIKLMKSCSGFVPAAIVIPVKNESIVGDVCMPTALRKNRPKPQLAATPTTAAMPSTIGP